MDTQTTIPAEIPEKVLLTIDKSDRDQIMVRETTFKDKEYFDIRVFNRKDGGDYFPTKKGVTLSREKMKELVKGIGKIKI
jgi:hypothetical protein